MEKNKGLLQPAALQIDVAPKRLCGTIVSKVKMAQASLIPPVTATAAISLHAQAMLKRMQAFGLARVTRAAAHSHHAYEARRVRHLAMAAADEVHYQATTLRMSRFERPQHEVGADQAPMQPARARAASAQLRSQPRVVAVVLTACLAEVQAHAYRTVGRQLVRFDYLRRL